MTYFQLNDADREHIAELIKEGFTEGDLSHENGDRSWWRLTTPDTPEDKPEVMLPARIDIFAMADELNFHDLTEVELLTILKEYPAEIAQDPTANWSEAVEELLYRHARKRIVRVNDSQR